MTIPDSRTVSQGLATAVGAGTPKVTVCMPVFNGSEYIAEAIESVLAQTYHDFQLIVSDNCSSDDTGAIVQRFDDPRIRYSKNATNLGLIGNMNRCLELATGEYLCIFHHDDVMLPENLARKVQVLDEHQAVGYVHSNIFIIDTRGDVLWSNIWSEDPRRDYIDDGLSVFQRHLSYLHFGASLFMGTVLARRECYQRGGPFSDALPHCADSEILLRMALSSKVACIGDPLVKYRVHQTSTSSSFGNYESLPYLKEHFLSATLVLERCKDEIPQVEAVRRQVAEAFGSRALSLAHENLLDGDFETGRSFLKEALKLSPGIVARKLFWKSVVRSLAGRKGREFYEVLKKQLVA
jgi:glycosyltransferase involved in cell wall biosynthesis